MIITKLQGGLVNQMFQYAVGRKLAILNHTKLELDVYFLNDKTVREHFTIRNLELDSFTMEIELAENNEVICFYRNNLFDRFRRKFGNMKIVNENGYFFHPELFDLKGNVYLNGYWQSEKYFVDIREHLLNEFTLKPELLEQINDNPKLSGIKQQIQYTQSVSIHFRRGDYVSDSVTSQFHGTASPDYYGKAIAFINERVPNPHFFLFTDDPDWVINQDIVKKIPCTLAVTSNMHLDMHLMSQCKHNIIANSSFSWWGAWLNRNNEKSVVAPKRWFAKDELNQQTVDLIPQSWIRL